MRKIQLTVKNYLTMENKINKNDKKNQYDSYCPVCSGCGEEGCCPPLVCKQSPDGHYCQTYLDHLKFVYLMYNSVYELIPKDEETQKKLDEIWKKNYDLIYITK